MVGAASRKGLVIVGACHAGTQIAASAREAGYEEPIILIGEEKALPYQRPPLSKGFLLGKVEEEGLALRSEAFYESNAIDLRLGQRAVRIDRQDRRLELADGSRLPFSKLALASGTRVRPLPLPGAGQEPGRLGGVHYLRGIEDAKHLRAEAGTAKAIAVVGGGFIGLEIAAALAGLGRKVTVIEAADRLMARAVGPEVSQFYAEQHRARGVELLLSCGLEALEDDGRGRIAGLKTSAGRIEADLLVVGIGVLPNGELASEAGLDCPNGIAVDACGRTSDPDILAAGDCALHHNAWANGGEGGPVRLESVQNAADQARSLGASLAGEDAPYHSVPWFWTDQFDLKMQMVGLSGGHDNRILRGSLDEGKFSVLYYRGEKLLAIDSVNRPADHIAGRKLLSAGISPTPEQAADAGLPLKSLLG